MVARKKVKSEADVLAALELRIEQLQTLLTRTLAELLDKASAVRRQRDELEELSRDRRRMLLGEHAATVIGNDKA